MDEHDLDRATDPAGRPDLEAQRVGKRYGGHLAVDDLSFSVARGSFFSILGPSGCGKTTLLRMIAGFLAPDAGTIAIGGKPMDGVPPNRRPVNMVFQHLALFPMMSVGENVGYGLARRGLAKPDIARRVGAMLERVSLPGAENKRIDQLSGGQKQRVAIARSLVLEPTLLLLDEPLGALDLKLREHMKIELKALQASFGTTFVYITHDQSEALVLSDHVAVMNAGRFEQLGTPQSLYYEPETAFVAGFVGANNRVDGTARAFADGLIELDTGSGLKLHCRSMGATAAGAQASAFVRPEVASLERTLDALPANQPRFQATVESLLFDGANSAALVREQTSRIEFRIALPQTGRFADLRVGEAVAFGFDPQRAVCFAATPVVPATCATSWDHRKSDSTRAGTQRLSQNDTGSPPSRGRQ
jgi:spermidine/putrescine transport system ATP-binding protein